MTQYTLTLNCEILTTGSFLDCWKFLVGIEGNTPLKEIEALGYSIQPIS